MVKNYVGKTVTSYVSNRIVPDNKKRSPGPPTITNLRSTYSNLPGNLSIGLTGSYGAGIGTSSTYGLTFGLDGSIALFHTTSRTGSGSVNGAGGVTIGVNNGKGAISQAGQGKSASAGLGVGPALTAGVPTDGSLGATLFGGLGESIGIDAGVESSDTDIWIIK
jgi:hypothetical protein